MTSSSPSNVADLLKAEGNALQQAGKYNEAYGKYSQAIKQDPKNAVLWANRAASALAMKKYMDAVTDAEKAAELDPDYAKAWGRQGTGYLSLGSWDKSIDAFKKALSCLPSDGKLSKANESLKTQFESGLKKAEANKNRVPTFKHVSAPAGSVHQDNLPWKRAMAMEQELIARKDVTSSGFVILSAYREFKEALDAMKKLEVTTINGEQRMMGLTQVIPILSNAIMRDRRVFHLTDRDFVEKYNKQMILEAQQSNAWTTGGPKLVEDEALERLKSLGWNAVRPALAITIRAWIMRGFLQSTFQTPGASAEFFSDALQVLEWGSRVWKDVPMSDRGVIFEPSFIRGVKRLYCNVLQETWSKTKRNLEEIATLAHQLINEKQAPPVGEVDPGFVSSFWVYPVADAYVNLGWYYLRKAEASSEQEEAASLCLLSATHYLKGANRYPTDDERHPMFLKVGLEALWFARSPLKITLPIAKQIREAIPVMKKIWEYSPDAPVWEGHFRMALEFEEHFTAEINAGRMTLENSGGPEGLHLKTRFKTR